MRIDVNHTDAKGKISLLKISHKDEEEDWNVETYNRSTFQKPQDLFSNINDFFERLPEKSQDKIWECYKEIHATFAEISDFNRLHPKLQKLVSKLYSEINFEDMVKWSYLYGDVQLPPDLKQEYTEEDRKSEKAINQTYLHSDYYNLATLSIYLKPMVPIFGEYIYRLTKDIGTRFKEHFALSLLSQSSFFNMPPVERLHLYIATLIEKEAMRNSAVFGGLGSAELPDWLMARVLVRRVAVSEVNAGENVISNVYHTIMQQLNSLDKTFGGGIQEKKHYKGSSEEDNISVAENYKIKQQISDGDLVVLSAYTQELHKMAKRIDPMIDLKKVDCCMKNADSNHEIGIRQHQLTITQWVVARAIPPRGIPLLNKPALLRSMAVTQSILWHWGFNELALLIFAEPKDSDGYNSPLNPTRLNKNYIEDFSKRFPHYQRISGKEQNPRHVNPACKAVDILSTKLIQTDWASFSPVELTKELGITQHGQPFIVPAEIRQQLADLVIRINDNARGSGV